MEERIRAIVLQCVSATEAKYSKKGADLARFLIRDGSYVTRIYKWPKGRNGTEIKPKSFRVAPPLPLDISVQDRVKERRRAKKETQQYRLFSLVCWLMLQRPAEPVYDVSLKLYGWLKVGSVQNMSYWSFCSLVRVAAADAAKIFATYKDDGKRPGPHEQKPRESKKAGKPEQQELPFNEPGKQEKEPQVAEGMKVPLATGIPAGAAKADIPVELWAKMVEHLKRDAAVNDGMFSISAVHSRFIDDLPEAKKPVEFLRRKDTKEQIELIAKVKGHGTFVIPKGTNRVSDIPDIPEVIYSCGIRGWCVCESLFLDYAMFISKEFKLVAMDILGQAAGGVLPQTQLSQELSSILAPISEAIILLTREQVAIRQQVTVALDQRDVERGRADRLDAHAKQLATDAHSKLIHYPDGFTNKTRMGAVLKELYPNLKVNVIEQSVLLWMRLCRWYERHYVVQSGDTRPGDLEKVQQKQDYTSKDPANSYYTTIEYTFVNESSGQELSSQKRREVFAINVMAALLTGHNWSFAKGGSRIMSPLDPTAWCEKQKNNMRNLISGTAHALGVTEGIQLNDDEFDVLCDLYTQLAEVGMDPVLADLRSRVLRAGGGSFNEYTTDMPIEDFRARDKRRRLGGKD